MNLSKSEWKLGPYAIVVSLENVPRVFRSLSGVFAEIEAATDTEVKTVYFNPETLRRLEIRDLLTQIQQSKSPFILWGAQIKSNPMVRRGFVRVEGANGTTSENILAPINIDGAEHLF